MNSSLRSRLLALAGVAALALAACGGDDSGSADTTAAASDIASATTAAGDTATTASADSEPGGELTKVRYALSWTPTTSDTGLYVALHEGYFADEGLEVEVLPYNQTSSDILVANGAAEFGVGFHSGLTYARAAGQPIKSVMAILQHSTQAIGVSADNDEITRPADLDGKTYAGFGYAGELATLKQVIQNDGGTGDFETVVLATAAYEAVYSGDADFTQPFVTWEGIEAELRGQPFKFFHPTDYGFPDEYSFVVVGNEGWMADNPEVTGAFVRALQKGYEFAVADPDAAAQILIDENPGAFTNEDLVFKSQELLSSDYMTDADGNFGMQTLEQWTGLSKFLFDSGLLTDAGGDALTEAPDYSTFFTNEYLSQS